MQINQFSKHLQISGALGQIVYDSKAQFTSLFQKNASGRVNNRVLKFRR